MDPLVSILKDTVCRQKQALVFCSSKRSAEKQAELLAKHISFVSLYEDISPDVVKETVSQLFSLADEFRTVLSHPTVQCLKNAACIEKGFAFHHAGLTAKQKTLLEDAFRDGLLFCICSTPTLAAGVDLPAFRSIIKDLKRYNGRWGMQFISVMEFLQMAGRAGRPGKEDFGEAICFAEDSLSKDRIVETFFNGEVESIQSKLAVEPVLRFHVLSLISSGFVTSKTELLAFFEETFYAKQFSDMYRLEEILDKVLDMLKEYTFITYGSDDTSSDSFDFFTDADSLDSERALRITPLGKRVAELYIDPFTAHHLLTALSNVSILENASLEYRTLSLLHALSHTLEMVPLLRVKKKDEDLIYSTLSEMEPYLLFEPDVFGEFYDSFKTALFFNDWIHEKDEEYLLETYDVRPGELRAKLDVIDWLMRCFIDFSKSKGQFEMVSELSKLQMRLSYGVKEDVIPLLQLKNIGRVRARLLVSKGFTTLESLRKASLETLGELLGPKTAENIKKQL